MDLPPAYTTTNAVPDGTGQKCRGTGVYSSRSRLATEEISVGAIASARFSVSLVL
jgi:hypothetical protein